jgi:hypothetical protein
VSVGIEAPSLACLLGRRVFVVPFGPNFDAEILGLILGTSSYDPMTTGTVNVQSSDSVATPEMQKNMRTILQIVCSWLSLFPTRIQCREALT